MQVMWWPELARPNRHGLRSLPSLRRAAIRQGHIKATLADECMLCDMLGADIAHWLVRCTLFCGSDVWWEPLHIEPDANALAESQRVEDLLGKWYMQACADVCKFACSPSAVLQERIFAQAWPFEMFFAEEVNYPLSILWSGALVALCREPCGTQLRTSFSSVFAAEARRCGAGLRFALLRFTMQRLVQQNLAAIKAHLWRPRGRLAQRQAADVLPGEQLAAAVPAEQQSARQTRAQRKRARDACGSDACALQQLDAQGQSQRQRPARRPGWEGTEDLWLWRQMQVAGALFRT